MGRSGFYFHPFTDEPAECLPPGVHADPAFYGRNLWPDEALPELKERARAGVPFLVNVGRKLAAAIDRKCAAVHSGYKPGSLSDLVRPVEDCNHKCRLILYHDYQNEEHRKECKGMWAAPHKDTCL